MTFCGPWSPAPSRECCKRRPAAGGTWPCTVARDPWGGWTTGAGVGVGLGGNCPQPASTDRDRSAMETELQEKALPEGPSTQAAAGYLYFPAPRRKDAAYDLEATLGGEKFLLPLGRAVR